MAIALLTWVTTGKRQFTGPPGTVIEAVAPPHDSDADSHVPEEKMRMESD